VPDLRFINPTPSGLPFSQGVQTGNLLFVAGQVGTGDGVGEQTRSALDGARAVLAEAGGDLTNIVSATVYLTDVADFGAYNDAWVEAFGEHRPARATVRAELMGPDYLVEVQAIAVLD
jgi:2-iminobutanoate/2-iminopropanoate deaminase